MRSRRCRHAPAVIRHGAVDEEQGPARNDAIAVIRRPQEPAEFAAIVVLVISIVSPFRIPPPNWFSARFLIWPLRNDHRAPKRQAPQEPFDTLRLWTLSRDGRQPIVSMAGPQTRCIVSERRRQSATLRSMVLCVAVSRWRSRDAPRARRRRFAVTGCARGSACPRSRSPPR